MSKQRIAELQSYVDASFKKYGFSEENRPVIYSYVRSDRDENCFFCMGRRLDGSESGILVHKGTKSIMTQFENREEDGGWAGTIDEAKRLGLEYHEEEPFEPVVAQDFLSLGSEIMKREYSDRTSAGEGSMEVMGSLHAMFNNFRGSIASDDFRRGGLTELGVN